MVILIDTNIFLDVYLNRNFPESLFAIKKAIHRQDRIYFSASSYTDFYYIACNQLHNKWLAREYACNLAKQVFFAAVNDECICSALNSEIDDLEDALVDSVAISINADYILTRDKKDFEHSIVKAITPTEFLSL